MDLGLSTWTFIHSSVTHHLFTSSIQSPTTVSSAQPDCPQTLSTMRSYFNPPLVTLFPNTGFIHGFTSPTFKPAASPLTSLRQYPPRSRKNSFGYRKKREEKFTSSQTQSPTWPKPPSQTLNWGCPTSPHYLELQAIWWQDLFENRPSSSVIGLSKERSLHADASRNAIPVVVPREPSLLASCAVSATYEWSPPPAHLPEDPKVVEKQKETHSVDTLPVLTTTACKSVQVHGAATELRKPSYVEIWQRTSKEPPSSPLQPPKEQKSNPRSCRKEKKLAAPVEKQREPLPSSPLPESPKTREGSLGTGSHPQLLESVFTEDRTLPPSLLSENPMSGRGCIELY